MTIVWRQHDDNMDTHGNIWRNMMRDGGMAPHNNRVMQHDINKYSNTLAILWYNTSTSSMVQHDYTMAMVQQGDSMYTCRAKHEATQYGLITNHYLMTRATNLRIIIDFEPNIQLRPPHI